jgi:iron complex outermembrane receptor protein
MRKFRILALASASFLTIATPAFAQETSVADGEADDTTDDIVVTGTLIRGIAPGGSQTIGINQEKIAAIGAVTTTDLVASVPQAGNFMAFASIRGTNGPQLMINRPSLRYLGNTASSSASTLLLVDGHRLPGMAIEQSTSDLDAIAPSAIERIDIVTDGGSSTYGSDAVGGVMNFITRRRFDGVEVKGSYGFADNYNQFNASILAGRTFGNVNAYIAYDYAEHDGLIGLDRDWSQSRDWASNVPFNNTCTAPNVRATVAGVTTTYALPGLTAGLGNRCDNSEYLSIYPKETKHNVMGSVLIDTGGPVRFLVKAYYVNRKTYSNGGELTVNGLPVPRLRPNGSPNDYYVALPGTPATETFFFNLNPRYGPNTRVDGSLESYGITPSVEWDIGGGWQMNAMFNYGWSNAKYIRDVLNTAPLNAAAALGNFDPVNLANPINTPALTQARDWFNYGRAKHDLINTRAVFDGPLFELPAGPVKVAVGFEYMKESFSGGSFISGATSAQITGLTDVKVSRNVKSVFGEINIPVLDDASGAELSISASGRYDHYSDFGSTFNPKFGVNFAPFSWLKVRGNWGKAFQAPGVSLLSQRGKSNFSLIPQVFSFQAGVPAGNRNNQLAFAGAANVLEPQKADTWSLGFDISPPVLEGFSAGLTYYSIDFKGVIARLPFTTGIPFYENFPGSFVNYPSGDAAMLAYFKQLTAEGSLNSDTTLARLPGNTELEKFSTVYGVADARQTNLGRIKTTGLDFYARMRKETGFGDVFADVSGNYILTFLQQAFKGAPTVSTVDLDTTRLRVSTSVGTNVGNFRAQVTWNHSQGYAIVPTVQNVQQTRVGSYNVFNLFFNYKVPGDSRIAKDLTLSLNIDNVFDQDPPLWRSQSFTAYGYANGFTLGRLVRFGVSKKF